MAYSIQFYSPTVQAEIEGWPPGINAGFTRIAEQMAEAGPNLGLPYTRALGDGLFEIRARWRGRHGPGVFLCPGGAANRHPARLHQEDATDADQGNETGASD